MATTNLTLSFCPPSIEDTAIEVVAQLKRIYVDSALHGPDSLRYVISRFGSERICLGSDYPFPLGENPPGSIIEQLDDITDQQRRQMLSETALEFLGMTASDLNNASDQQASTA